MNAVSITGIAAAGLILGVIYQRTRNLWLVAALHAAMDILYAAMPTLPVAPGAVLVVCNLLAGIGALVWWRLDAGRQSPPEAGRL